MTHRVLLLHFVADDRTRASRDQYYPYLQALFKGQGIPTKRLFVGTGRAHAAADVAGRRAVVELQHRVEGGCEVLQLDREDATWRSQMRYIWSGPASQHSVGPGLDRTPFPTAFRGVAPRHGSFRQNSRVFSLQTERGVLFSRWAARPVQGGPK
jgi:hypothetical protein